MRSTCTTAAVLVFLAGTMAFAEAPYTGALVYGDSGVTVGAVTSLTAPIVSGQPVEIQATVSGEIQGQVAVLLYYQRLTDHGPGHQATQDVLIGYQMLDGLSGTRQVSLSGASPFEIGWDEEPTGDVFYMVKISTRDKYAGLDAPPDDGNVINPVYTDAGWWVSQTEPTSGTTLGDGGGVTPPTNHAPTIQLTSPASGTLVVVGCSVTFTCNATDPDGDSLTYSWSSNLQGTLSTEASFSLADLAMGSHIVTVIVSDGSTTRTAQVQLTVWSGNYPPTVAISSPAPASYHAMGDAVQLSCNALDADGDPLSYEWSPSLDGQLGTAADVNTSSLSEGTHMISVTVDDGHGNTAGATVVVIVIQDDDRDGMADGWEELYGSDLVADEDLDADGYTNLQEYLAGTDPTNPDSYPGMGSGGGGVSCAVTTAGGTPSASVLVLGLAAAALAVCILSAVSPAASASMTDEVLLLTDAAPMRIVWCRETTVMSATYIFESSSWQLMKYDTAVGAVEVLAPGPASYQHPLITPDGQQVLYFDYDTNKTCIINWDGSGKQEFCSGYLYDVFRDDSGVDWVVVNDWIHVWNRPQPSGAVNVRKVRLDNPAVEEAILTYPDQKGETFDVSQDCSMGGGLLIHPIVGVYDLGTGAFSQRGTYACNTDVAPDNSYMFWHMQGGGHTNVVLYYSYPTADNRTVWLNNAPNLNGAESWNPRWTNNVRIFTMTGPIAWVAGNPRFNIYVGRFDTNFTQVESWVQLTDNDLLDGNANGWIGQAGPAAPSIVSSAPARGYVGVEYAYALSAAGSPSPTFSASGEPAGLTLSGSTLSGTPDASDAGTTGAITVTAANAEGSDSQTFQIEVVAGDSSLVGYWSFDEQFSPGLDGSIYGNDGTLVGGAAWTASGQSGGAVDFTGAGCVSVPDSASVSVSGDVTIAAWFRLSALEDGVFNVVGKDYNNAYRLRLGVNQGSNWCGFEFFTNDGGGQEGGWYSCPALLSANTWYHLAASFDSSTAEKRFYLDGAYGGSQATTGRSITDTMGALALGSADAAFAEGWKGLLDEIRLYNRVLSDQEVADLLDGGSSPTAPAITSTPATQRNSQAALTPPIPSIRHLARRSCPARTTPVHPPAPPCRGSPAV
jgi:hypothetical protein